MPAELDKYLFFETLLVLILAIFAVKCVSVIEQLSEVGWLLSPLILVVMAFVPNKMRQRKFGDLGFTNRQLPASFKVLGATCLVVFPISFCGLWILRSNHIMLPMPSTLPEKQGWFGWLFYQFFYVALAEEVFFRGYLQSNILKFRKKKSKRMLRLVQMISILLSAVCFSFAHVIIQGHLTALLTFFPGLVLGWLFIRTGSLIAPIFFHGLANVSYILMAGLFD